MTMFQDVDAEQLARSFHHYQEALAVKPEHSEDNGAGSWEHAPLKTRRLMVDAARLTLQELSTAAGTHESSRKYYAKPGEADWGC